MSRYFKHQELVIFDLANGNRQQMRLDSLYPIDKMRISVFDAVDNTQYKPVIVVNSDLTNSIIGTAATNYIDNTIGFLSNLKPLNGIEFYQTNKMIVQGVYNVWFTDMNNNPITGFTNDLSVLVEYYA